MLFNFKSRYEKKDHGPIDAPEDYVTDCSGWKPDSDLTLAARDSLDTAINLGKFSWHAINFGFYAVKSVVQLLTHGVVSMYDNPDNVKNTVNSLVTMASDAMHALDAAIDTVIDASSMVIKGIASTAAFVAPSIASGFEVAVNSISEAVVTVGDYLFPALESVSEIEMQDIAAIHDTADADESGYSLFSDLTVGLFGDFHPLQDQDA